MRERDFRGEVRLSLSQLFPESIFFTMTNIFSSFGGAPDLIGCIKGIFVAFECKLLKNPHKGEKLPVKYTRLQEIQAERIKKAGGLVFGLVNVRPLRKVYVTEVKNQKGGIEFSQVLGKVQGVWEIHKISRLFPLFVEGEKSPSYSL